MASNTSDNLAKFTVVELRNILKNHGYFTSGTKDILIQRILENITNIVLPIKSQKLSSTNASTGSSLEDIVNQMLDLKQRSASYKNSIQRLIDNNNNTLYVRSRSIDFKEFSILVDALMLNTSVTSLNISKVSMPFRAAMLIKKVMLTDRFVSLSISDVSITRSSNWLKGVNSGIEVSTRLSTLSLRDNRIPFRIIAKLVPSLLTITTLTSLDLSNNISSVNYDDIINNMLINNKLDSLYLSSNDLKREYVDMYCNIFNSTTLKTLDLSGNISYDNSMFMCREKILNDGHTPMIYVYSKKIQKFNDGHRAIIDGIRRNTSIESLNMSKNIVGKDFIMRLCDAVAVSKNITWLNISNITGSCDDDASDVSNSIANLIKSNVIQYLDISNNELGSLKDIANALEHNTSLQQLYMRNNKCTDVEHVFKSLSKNNHLMNLGLAGTYVGHIGIVLADVMRCNQSLKYIDLSSTHLDIDAIQAIIGGLVQNGSMTLMNLSDNPLIENNVINMVEHLLLRNKINIETKNKQLWAILDI